MPAGHNTLRPQKTLAFPTHLKGLQFGGRLGRRCSKGNHVFSCWSFWRARRPPPWTPSFVGLVARGSAEAGSRLLSALTDLVNVMLRGEVPQFSVPIFYGANECEIRKINVGVRPIAVGSTIRRL